MKPTCVGNNNQRKNERDYLQLWNSDSSDLSESPDSSADEPVQQAATSRKRGEKEHSDVRCIFSIRQSAGK